MTVIPFGNEANDATYTTTKNDFSIHGSMILIQDIDKSQFFQESKDGNATYNLRIGSEYRSYNDKDITTISDKDTIYVGAGSTIVIKTLEFVHFPSSRYGLILPKVSLLQRGLSTVASKVDPGYQGNLIITLFNHSRETARLKYGDQFCSLTLFDVGKSIRLYDKPAKNMQGAGKNFMKKTRDLININAGVIFVLSSIIYVIISIFRSFGIYKIITDMFQK